MGATAATAAVGATAATAAMGPTRTLGAAPSAAATGWHVERRLGARRRDLFVRRLRLAGRGLTAHPKRRGDGNLPAALRWSVVGDDELDVDVAPGGIGVRTHLVGFLSQRKRGIVLHVGQRHLEFDREAEAAVVELAQ